LYRNEARQILKNLEWFQGLEKGWNKVLAKMKEIAER